MQNCVSYFEYKQANAARHFPSIIAIFHNPTFKSGMEESQSFDSIWFAGSQFHVLYTV